MDSKLLLVRIITLLYLESLITKKNGANSRTVVQDALSYIKAPEAVIIADFSKDSITKLRETIQWLLLQQPGEKIDRLELLNRLRLATEHEDYIFDSIFSTIDTVGDNKDDIKKVVDSSRLELHKYINRNQIMSTFKEFYQMTHFKPDSVDWDNIVQECNTRLEPLKGNSTGIDNSSLVESVDLTNVESLSRVFQEGLAELKPDGIIRFGWQGFNRMFGSRGGARRGEFIVVGALQHNFKSGTSLEMLIGAALFNKPYMIDPSKKPLLLRFSLENSVIEDIIHVYRSLVETETGVQIDEDSVDPIIAATYVNERLSVNGYHVKFERRNPSELTYNVLFKIIEDYEAQGYEVHMCNIDYLAMMSTKGCKQGATGQDIRDLFRRTRNFFSAKNILGVTPHQISTEAKKKTREGVDDFVREIANKGYWDSCSTIDQEVDMEIYQHLVRISGITYITWMRGKHRKSGKPTPYEDYYTVYQFDPRGIGFIPYDVLGADMSRKRVGAGAVSEGSSGDAWWN